MLPEILRDDVFRLESQRLWLRWPTARDEATVERFAGDRRVADATASIPHPYPKGSAASFIYGARVGNTQGSALTFAIAPMAAPHELMGVIDLRFEHGVPTLGYWLGPPFWGRGLMAEAVETLVRTTFSLTNLPGITASACVGNHASQRVLEKCGFRQTGEQTRHLPAREASFDCLLFERSRSDERRCSEGSRRVSAR